RARSGRAAPEIRPRGIPQGRAPLDDPPRALRVQGAKTRVPGLHHPGPVRIPEENESLKAAKLQRTTLGEGQKRFKQRSIPCATAAAIRLRVSSDWTFSSSSRLTMTPASRR